MVWMEPLQPITQLLIHAQESFSFASLITGEKMKPRKILNCLRIGEWQIHKLGEVERDRLWAGSAGCHCPGALQHYPEEFRLFGREDGVPEFIEG